MFYYSRQRRKLVPFNEAPFCFFDHSGGGYSQVAVRFHLPAVLSSTRSYFLLPRYLFDLLGRDDPVRSVRYSFDLDADTHPTNRYDYDFSVSGVGTIVAPPAMTTRLRLRNMATEPAIDCARAQELTELTEFSALSLAWDEDDANHDPNDGERRERWEGVINRGSSRFPQIGGPASAGTNKRTEIADEGRHRVGLYYSDIDKRIHLRGARIGVLRIDYDLDGKVDLVIEYRDTDGNGVFDQWLVDVDGDGKPDRIGSVKDERATPLTLDYRQLSAFWRARRAQTIDEYENLIRKIKRVVKPGTELSAERYYASRVAATSAQTPDTRADARFFYLGVILELYFHELRRWLGTAGVPEAERRRIEQMYDSGEYHALGRALNAFK